MVRTPDCYNLLFEYFKRKHLFWTVLPTFVLPDHYPDTFPLELFSALIMSLFASHVTLLVVSRVLSIPVGKTQIL